ncbi:HsdM family class I SAM-dependent methyltransferase [Helicobacter sp. T3_23-1059]
MAKKEVKTDFWVYSLLQSAGIHADPQGSSIKEIDEALKSASKKGTGNAGFPEFIAVVKDFLLVIEDKAGIDKHIKLDSNDCIDLENPQSVMDYAVNGAIHYAKHLAKYTSYTKIIAIAVSGDEKHHKISPYFVSERGFITALKEIEDFIVFSEANIDEYYTKEILNEKTDFEKSTEQILKDASILHEDLRNYGNLRDTEKPIVVSGILLALEEIKHKNFSIDNLNGDSSATDGEKIYKAISDNLKRANVRPEVKKDKLLAQFSIIKDTPKINEINATLGKTPLKHYAEFLNKHIYKSFGYTHSSEDILGRFYSEFMSYSGGDGQTLGIVLTPRHICELFCDLADLRPDDVVFDPCCGTAGFLIAAMNTMLNQIPNDETKRNAIKQNQLFGIEEKPDMFSIATTNMILRGDGKSNLKNKDFLKQNPSDLQKDICASVGMLNPPYLQGGKDNPNLYEIAFVKHLLDSLAKNTRCIVIIPQSALAGKNKAKKAMKENILKHHTLEGVITLNKNTF